MCQRTCPLSHQNRQKSAQIFTFFTPSIFRIALIVVGLVSQQNRAESNCSSSNSTTRPESQSSDLALFIRQDFGCPQKIHDTSPSCELFFVLFACAARYFFPEKNLTHHAYFFLVATKKKKVVARTTNCNSICRPRALHGRSKQTAGFLKPCLKT